MKIRPKVITDPYKHLTPLQNTTRIMAIVIAFVGVFIWVIKILFLA